MRHEAFGIVWDGESDKPTETRWMVMLASMWAPSKLLQSPFMNYWYEPYVMLSNPLMRVHCKFATALGERVMFSVSVSVLPVRATKSLLIF